MKIQFREELDAGSREFLGEFDTTCQVRSIENIDLRINVLEGYVSENVQGEIRLNPI